MEPCNAFAPRIYYLHPLLIGPLPAWDAHFERAARMGFDHVLIAPPFAPGPEGDIFVSADHHRVNAAFGTDADANTLLAQLAAAAQRHGLALLIDAVVDRISGAAGLYRDHPNWFHPPQVDTGPFDPRLDPAVAHSAYANFAEWEAAQQLSDWWARQLLIWADAGVAGYRFEAPHHVPAHIWRRLAAAVRETHPQARFLAWTPGLARADVRALQGAGFDAVFSSLSWWDFQADWFADEHASLTRVAPPIAFPESPYGNRLSVELAAHDAATIERAYRRALSAAASLGSGLLVPMGFEFGSRTPLLRERGNPAEFDAGRAAAAFDLSAELARINALAASSNVLRGSGELRMLTGAGTRCTALLRADSPDARQAAHAALIIINADLEHPVRVQPERFLDGVPGGFTWFAPLQTDGAAGIDTAAASAAGTAATPLAPFILGAGATRVFDAQRAAPIITAASAARRGAKAAERRTASAASRVPRIAIEAITPSVDAGRFAAKRVVGETLIVEADIFTDGHDHLAAAVLWRPLDPEDNGWRSVPMAALVNDRWRASFTLDRVGAYEFTVEAWRDTYGTLVEHIRKKVAAKQDVALELIEAKQLVDSIVAGTHDAAAEGTEGGAIAALAALFKPFGRANAAQKLALATAAATVRAVAAADPHEFGVRHEGTLQVIAERSAARFASWYELFPRSQSGDGSRHGTFIDVIARLPAIRDMGFDVLYFPPIHPIGLKNRKGPNNSLQAGPTDVGSPYAIGAAEGGHTAIHPELGSFDDFRALQDAAREHGMEIVLDFAIQCSPDHPWLAEHPGWFAWRPDGTLRYAENPPKKYQDIVNPDFYAADSIPSLWLALRDVVLFWAEAGVRTFRVDNPHTKPLPFWEWMIGEVRSRYPDTIFLSEAFTRPKVMKRLAKVGFSQSYTYFTWRESKREFIEYLTELTQTDAREYLRPNFFVNTPDINPRFLQTSGRAGFVIRAALAATLSGLWGVYSGFELCEAAALPGSEEYLDSEKYQLRAWDWNRPGNIIGEITLLNQIRRMNPALHSHLGITFLPANNERILFFEKATPARDNVLLVAINLDPFNVQEADIELPLAAWQLGDGDALAAEDLVSGARFEMHGRWQRIRLDPGALPFAIRRVRPLHPLPAELLDNTLVAELDASATGSANAPPNAAPSAAAATAAAGSTNAPDNARAH